jgi:hypothetical protein
MARYRGEGRRGVEGEVRRGAGSWVVMPSSLLLFQYYSLRHVQWLDNTSVL